MTADRPPPAALQPRRLRQLRRGDRLVDRGGRIWTVQAAPYHADRLDHVVIRSGDLVRRLDERWADEFELLPPDATA